MKTWLIPAAVAPALLLSAGTADAKGCIRGAVAGGVAGHYAHHHAVLGAAAGCMAGRAYYRHRAASAHAQPARH